MTAIQPCERFKYHDGADKINGQSRMTMPGCSAQTLLQPGSEPGLAGDKTASVGQVLRTLLANVPGPQVPLYFLGSKLLAIYPMMPLFPNQALSVAVLSYNGDVFWGFNSDWDSLPDVHNVVEGIGAQFGELRAVSSGRS